MNKPLKVFITYAHKNREAKDKLIECLAVIKNEGLISIWHDNEILPGDKWREEFFPHTCPIRTFSSILFPALALLLKTATKN